MRRGNSFVRVGQVKYGADARELDAEMASLAVETKLVLGGANPVAILRAAAFYHFRFENSVRAPEDFRARMKKATRAINTATKEAGFGDFTVRPPDLGLDVNAVFELEREHMDRNRPSGAKS